MGFLVIFVMDTFELEGFYKALVFSAPVFVFGLGFFYSSIRIWTASALIFILSVIIIQMGNDPALSGLAINGIISNSLPFIEGISVLILSVTAIIGSILGRPIGGLSTSNVAGYFISRYIRPET